MSIPRVMNVHEHHLKLFFFSCTILLYAFLRVVRSLEWPSLYIYKASNLSSRSQIFTKKNKWSINVEVIYILYKKMSVSEENMLLHCILNKLTNIKSNSIWCIMHYAHVCDSKYPMPRVSGLRDGCAPSTLYSKIRVSIISSERV